MKAFLLSVFLCATLAASAPLLIKDDGVSDECRRYFIETPRNRPLDCAAVRESYLYSPECGATQGNRTLYDLLVTATPRSGTVYTQTLLKRAGVPVDNDWVVPRARAVSSWILAFNDSDPFCPVTQLGRRFRHVLHQVREPLASLTSLACAHPLTRPDFAAFVARNVPYPYEQWRDAHPLRLAMQFYVGWQDHLNRLPAPTYRLEDMSAELVGCILALALPPADRPSAKALRAAIDRVPTRTNTRPHRPSFTWGDLRAADDALARRVWELAQRWGYEAPLASLADHAPEAEPPACGRISYI